MEKINNNVSNVNNVNNVNNVTNTAAQTTLSPGTKSRGKVFFCSYIRDQEISPCKDCKDRKPGCHGTCSKYKEWNEDRLKKKEEMLHKINKEKLIDDYEAHRAIKKKKNYELKKYCKIR